MIVNDRGVFIGLVNLPINEEQDFKQKYLEELFNGYKNSFINNTQYNLPAELYQPTYFFLFGNFDLCIISEVDDFVFGYQKFNPNSDCVDPQELPHNFNYQVYNCTTTNNKAALKSSQYAEVVRYNEHPFISITALKIKNSLITGMGLQLVENIVQLLRHEIDLYNNSCNEVDRVKYLFLETTSWHEILLLITGNSYNSLGNLIFELREKTHNNLLKFNKKIDFFKNSLWKKWEGNHEANSNLFSSTHTYFGVKYDSLLNDDKFQELLISSKNIKYSSNWHVKPGHFDFITEELKKVHPGVVNSPINIVFGDGDIEYETLCDLPEMFKYYKSIITKQSEIIKEGLRKTRTIPKILLNVNRNQNDRLTEPNNIKSKLFEQLIINQIKISEINSKLCKLNVSKAVRQRTLKVINNYNNAICDRQLYIYFIDLRHFVENFTNYILTLDENNTLIESKTINGVLNDFADIFNQAYSNKIQHSLRTIDLTDFNLDFNGGIQQIVSSLDFVFKIFRDCIGYYQVKSKGHFQNKKIFNTPCVTYLSGIAGVYSDENSLQINYYHVTQPEILFSTIFKEAFNYYNKRKEKKFNNLSEIGLIMSLIELNKELELNKVIDQLFKEKGISPIEGIENNYEEFSKVKLPEHKVSIWLSIFEEFHTRGTLVLQRELLTLISNRIIEHKVVELINILRYTYLIDYEIFDYFYADYTNFKCYYNEDQNLFKWWFWLHFFQEPGVYDINGKTNEDIFLKAFIRFTILFKFINLYKTYSIEDFYEPFFVDPLKKELFDKHFINTDFICDLLFDNKFLCGLLQLKDLTEYKPLKYLINNEKKKEEERAYILLKKVFSGKSISNNYIHKFLSNSIRETKLEDSEGSLDVFLKLNCLFMAYLKLILENVYTKEFDVQRNSNGVIIINQNAFKNRGSIQVDPHGGVFVSKQMRRKYFRLKNFVFRILINYSLIYKLKLFEDEN